MTETKKETSKTVEHFGRTIEDYNTYDPNRNCTTCKYKQHWERGGTLTQGFCNNNKVGRYLHPIRTNHVCELWEF